MWIKLCYGFSVSVMNLRYCQTLFPQVLDQCAESDWLCWKASFVKNQIQAISRYNSLFSHQESEATFETVGPNHLEMEGVILEAVYECVKNRLKLLDNPLQKWRYNDRLDFCKTNFPVRLLHYWYFKINKTNGIYFCTNKCWIYEIQPSQWRFYFLPLLS